MLPLFLICVSFHGGVEQGGEKGHPLLIKDSCAAHWTHICASFRTVYTRDKTKNEWELTRLKESEERAKASGREQAFGKWWYGDLAEERVTHCFSVLHLETD